jgi:hypothetical protein
MTQIQRTFRQACGDKGRGGSGSSTSASDCAGDRFNDQELHEVEDVPAMAPPILRDG